MDFFELLSLEQVALTPAKTCGNLFLPFPEFLHFYIILTSSSSLFSTKKKSTAIPHSPFFPLGIFHSFLSFVWGNRKSEFDHTVSFELSLVFDMSWCFTQTTYSFECIELYPFVFCNLDVHILYSCYKDS